MEKKKKIILISIISIIVLALVIGLIIFFANKNNSNNEVDQSSSKISAIYEQLNSKTSYTYTATLDDENSMTYVKKDNMAYIDEIYEGDESKYVIKDGNTYLINDNEKVYYTYQNNEVDLNKIVEELNNVKSESLTSGKEKINNKEYDYEEYPGLTGLSITLFEDDDESMSDDIKTRFYFKGDNLVYIKTIKGQDEEILKIDISNKIDDNLFEIPSDYEER